MTGFFIELQRRKVYRVAVAYGVVAWLVIQIAATVFPAWELPNWALRLVIVVVLAGFPIALILAWAFDVTPGGVQATPRTAFSDTEGSARVRKSMWLLVVLGIAISAVAGFFLLPRASAHKIEKSIAVLPFENLSDAKENAYFADGIQDDVLTNLSKIGDLKVISRTSVMPYRGGEKNVKEIAKALGVSTILEGSVRREGNRVRINVQLIDAENDRHLWAEDYDRDLTDVFAIQSDLAREIAGALQAKLSPHEEARLQKRPTQNGEAYLAYLQAHDYQTRPDSLSEDTSKAEELYQKAIQLDPTFALAFAQLSRLESWIYHGHDASPARIEKARVAANEALRLQPDLPEGHVALGYCYYYGARDYKNALAEFARAQQDLPNDSDVFLAIAAIERRQGKWTESTAHFKQATSLNPKNPLNWQNLGINYVALRDYPAAADAYDRGLAVAPHSMVISSLRWKLEIDWKGDTKTLEKALDALPPGFDPDGQVTMARSSLKLLQRQFTEAAQIILQSPRDTFATDAGVKCPKSFFVGIVYLLGKDSAKARPLLEQSIPFFESSVRTRPDGPMEHANLGLAYAALGRKEDAVREGKRAVELLPESVDALDGPYYVTELASIYAWTGDLDNAFSLLEHSLSHPGGISVALLRLDPVWDPLRNDPRFPQLLKKYGGA